MHDSIPDLEDMINKHGDKVLRICYTYLKDTHLAEDAFQETFIRVYQKFRTFKGKSSENTWIMRIAINTCKNYLRTSWFKKIVLMDHSTIENNSNLTGRYETNEYKRLEMVEEIMELKPIYKEVIYLFYYFQLNVAEIATVLRIKESTVTVRLSRARDQLKTSLERRENIG